MSSILHILSLIKYPLFIPALYFLLRAIGQRGANDSAAFNLLGVALIYSGLAISAHGLSDRRRDRKIRLGQGPEKAILLLAFFCALALLIAALYSLISGTRPFNDSVTIGLISLGLGLLSGVRTEIEANKYWL